MEEASIAFNVPGEEEEGSDEEEERQRKEELHQLLTEQLQEDLLDDSVSTVTTEDGAADSTLLGEGMGVSLDHVTSPIQSCDLLPVNGAESGELLSGSEPAGQSGCGQKEVSDVFSGTAQAYSLVHCLQNSQPPATQLERDNHTHQEVTSSPLIEGCGQLEVLYGARCRQVTELTQQLAQAREEKERQERVLRYEKSQLEARLCAERQELETKVSSLSQQLSEASSALEALRGEREEVCAMLHPPTVTETGSGDVAKRLIELSAEKEDLQYQLSCCQGQLENQTLRAKTAEEEMSRISHQLTSVENEAEDLRSEVTRLAAERERERESSAAEKREALEKCRLACLQLHEDATERLREAMAAEKETLLLEHRHKLSALQEQLSSAQLEYVKVCEEKEKIEGAHEATVEQTEEEWQARTEQLIQAARERERERERDAVRKAVERAREQWRQTLAEESRQSVEMAISSTRQQWQARLAAEKEAVWREAAAEREATVRAALENARSQWRAKQAEVEEAERKSHHSASEPVLNAAQVHSMVENTVAAVKRDVRQMLEEVVRVGREREQQAVAKCRLATAEEMKTHYLSCLHLMVNSSTGTEPAEGKTVASQSRVVGTNQNKTRTGVKARGQQGPSKVRGHRKRLTRFGD